MKSILVPTDFSDAALHAALFAASLARDTGTDLHLLNVYHLPNPLKTLPIELIVTPDELKSDTESALKQIAQELRSSVGASLNITLASRNGETRRAINDYATYAGAGLIVTGMKGKNAVQERLIGNTALELLRSSTVPVLSIPQTAEYRQLKTLLFATDGKSIPDPESVTLLRNLLNHHPAGLHIGCVQSPHDNFDRDQLMTSLNPLLSGMQATWHFLSDDDENTALEKLGREIGAYWLALLPQKHSLFSRIFQQNHTRQLALHAGLPILALRNER